MVRIWLSAAVNLVILGWFGYTTYWYFAVFKPERTRKQKMETFRYFTYNSNALSAAASLAVLVCDALSLRAGTLRIPFWVTMLRFVGTASVTVTFLTVIFFLAPIMGWGLLYKGDNLFMHVVGPLLAVLSLTAIENTASISLPQCLWGVVPVVLYAVIYLRKVVYIGEEKGGWPDFYFFLRGGKWGMSFTAMTAAGFAVSVLLMLLNNAFV